MWRRGIACEDWDTLVLRSDRAEPETIGRTGINADPFTISSGTQHCAKTFLVLETIKRSLL